MRKINILSLFDGVSCGRVALQRAGIPVNKYYASEIDKYAIMIAQNNFPDTIQLGDVTKWEDWDIDWGSIDLLIGGSPCQGFSFAGKQLNFNDPRSKLFFDYVNILRHIQKYNPNVKFLLENVKMKKEFSNIIDTTLGVQPIEINSALVSAQNRKRLYWANWEFGQPEDKHIMLKDIVHEYSDELPIKYTKRNMRHYKDLNDKSLCCTATMYKGAGNNGMTLIFEKLQEYIVPFDKTLQILNKEVERGKVGYFGKDSQANRVYYIRDKAVTLCGSAGGGAAKMGQYLFGVVNKPRGNNNGGLRYDGKKSPTLTSNSWEHNNHLLFGCLTPDRVNKRQNGQRFNEGDKFYTLTAQDKHGVLVEGYIRKLTPVECERLQTLPEIKKYVKLDFENKEIEWFAEPLKINALSAVEKCHKWQKLVGNAEKRGLNEFVQYAVKNLSLKNQQTKKPVVWNVHISYEELTRVKNLIEKQLKSASNVVKVLESLRQETFRDFVLQTAGMHTTSGKTVFLGKEELHQKEKNLLQVNYEKNELNKYGKEIMRLVKDVGEDTTTMEKLLKYIISSLLLDENTEQNLAILYYFVQNVIIGCTQTKTPTRILLTINRGYTECEGVSNTQRYKALGNGWTVDVIAHILKSLDFGE